MTSQPPTFSIRRAALAVTTITVAFSAGEAIVGEPARSASVAPANDVSPATVRAFQRVAAAELAPVVDPYADARTRRSWQGHATPSASLLPVARVVEASAHGYVVQVGAYRESAAQTTPAGAGPEVARLGPVTARL